jgi:hypothetical protein
MLFSNSDYKSGVATTRLAHVTGEVRSKYLS